MISYQEIGKYKFIGRDGKEKSFELIIAEIIQKAKKEVFDDMEKCWHNCSNEDVRELILEDIGKLRKLHL